MALRTLSDVPQALVDSVAMGVATHEAIQARFDVSDEDWDFLTEWSPFKRAVAARRAEYEAAGLTPKLRAALQAQDMNDELYVVGCKSDTPTSLKIEIAKHLSKIAGIDQPVAVKSEQGTSFVVNINLDRSAADKTREQAVRVVDQAPKTLSKSEGFKIDFDVSALENLDLET